MINHLTKKGFDISQNSYQLLRVFLRVILIFCTLFYAQHSVAQAEQDLLIADINKASSDSDRIVCLGKLANFYFKNKQEDKADSIIEKQMVLSEESGNENLISFVLFNNPRYNFPSSSSRNVSTKSYDYITRALEYARRQGLNDKCALAYSNLSALYLSEGKMDEAFRNANLGFATAQGLGNDSVVVLCGLRLGDVYVAKSEAVMAFKTYTNAFDVANHLQNASLLSNVYHSISNLYKGLEQPEIAKKYIYKSLDLNKQAHSIEGQLKDYIALGKLTDYHMAIDFAERAEKLADSTHNNDYSLQAQKIIFNQKLVAKDPVNAFNYLNSHPRLVAYYKNTGPEYFSWVIGEVYLFGKKADSALPYFKQAEAAFGNGYDINSKKSFYEEFGQAYDQTSQSPLAIKYYQQALAVCKEGGDLKGVARISKELKNIYEQQSNYKQALYFSNQYELYQNSISELAKDRDLALLEIENENKRRAKEEELAQIKVERNYNLQYMGITVAVATMFVLLITLGMFKVHHFTIKILGFLSFIFLFEFLFMLLDKTIHNITHGEPYKVWLIKIALISGIFPIHHYLEEKLIHYLISKRLMEMRQRFSLTKFISRPKRKLQTVKDGEAEIIASPSPVTQ